MTEEQNSQALVSSSFLLTHTHTHTVCACYEAVNKVEEVLLSFQYNKESRLWRIVEVHESTYQKNPRHQACTNILNYCILLRVNLKPAIEQTRSSSLRFLLNCVVHFPSPLTLLPKCCPSSWMRALSGFQYQAQNTLLCWYTRPQFMPCAAHHYRIQQHKMGRATLSPYSLQSCQAPLSNHLMIFLSFLAIL